MKISFVPPEPSPVPPFEPVTITFRFDTQAELSAVGRLFNFSPVTGTLNELAGSSAFSQSFRAFEEAGAGPLTTPEVRKILPQRMRR